MKKMMVWIGLAAALAVGLLVACGAPLDEASVEQELGIEWERTTDGIELTSTLEDTALIVARVVEGEPTFHNALYGGPLDSVSVPDFWEEVLVFSVTSSMLCLDVCNPCDPPDDRLRDVDHGGCSSPPKPIRELLIIESVIGSSGVERNCHNELDDDGDGRMDCDDSDCDNKRECERDATASP